MQRGLPTKRSIAHVKKVIAVSSAKGGVGKSTIAVNLSLSLARLGLRTGILDTDIFGPSIPTLFGLEGHEPHTDPLTSQILPLSALGVQTMSLGYLMPPSAPLVWRGPLLLKALQQLLHSVRWGSPHELDVLVLDLPPGTGDVPLSIAQQVHLAGAVVVTTPHVLALADAERGLAMFGKVGVDVLGLVQNMGVFCCPGCGESTKIFGEGRGVHEMCSRHGLEVLADVPLHPSVGGHVRGTPVVVAEPESERARMFAELARRVGRKIGVLE